MHPYANIGINECILRYVFGGVVIVGILMSLLPPSMALLAAYAVLTAMVAWEPMYTLFSYVSSYAGRNHALRSARLLPHARSKHKAIHGM